MRGGAGGRGSPGRPRVGFGLVLPLVGGLMMLLFLGAMVQLFHTGSSLHLSTHDAGGAVAENAAQSYIEEALWRFQRQVNDPESEVFEAVRRQLVEGNEPVLDLTEWCQPERFPELLEASPGWPLYRHLQLESLSIVMRTPMRPDALAELDEGEADTGVIPGEQFVDVDCAVSLTLGEAVIWRRVCARRRYGITFVSPYKPFDQVTFAIIESGFLQEYPMVLATRRGMMLSINLVAVQLSAFQRQVLAASRRRAAGEEGRVRFAPAFIPVGEPPPMNSRQQGALAHDPLPTDMVWRSEAERGWAEWNRIRGDPSATLDRPAPAVETALDLGWMRLNLAALNRDSPQPEMVVFSAAPRVDLRDFDYDRRFFEHVQPTLERVEEAIGRYNRAWTDLFRTPDAPLEADELERFADEVGQTRDEIRDAAIEMVRELNRITTHANRHTTAGLSRETFDGYMSRASRRLFSLAYHLETPEDLRALREELLVFNGHVNYNGTDPLHLSERSWRGKTVISAPWRGGANPPVSLSGFTVQDPSRDLVMLNFGEVHFSSGTVEAGVFVADRAVFHGAPSIEGNLILRRVPAWPPGQLGDRLRGSVHYNPRLASGQLWARAETRDGRRARMPDEVSRSHYTVGLCPRSYQRVIFRSPDARGQDLDLVGEPAEGEAR